MHIQPGDLAISIHTQLPQNNGLIVQVVRPYENNLDIPMTHTCWWCTCAHLMTWKVGERTVQAHTGPVPEACLFPIRGIGLHGQKSSAKRPSRKARPLRSSAAPVAGSPAIVIKTLPETLPAHEEELAD